jgi:hypothetical protein
VRFRCPAKNGRKSKVIIIIKQAFLKMRGEGAVRAPPGIVLAFKGPEKLVARKTRKNSPKKEVKT